MKEKLKNLTVLSQFEDILVPLTEEEFNLLEESINLEGCKEPLVIWKRGNNEILIDGHNRYKICQKNGISFDVDFREYKDENEAIQWIINHQLGRRNLSPDQFAYYRGLKYLKEKKSRGGYDKVLLKGQQGEASTSEMLADEFNVSRNTILRDANFAQGLELIGESNPDLKLQILQGKSDFRKKDIQFLAKVEGSPTFKNEADLYNKLVSWKNEALDKVEEVLHQHQPIDEQKEEEEEIILFPDYEARVRRIKGQILSYLNEAIEKKNLEAVQKLRNIIDQLETLIME